MDGLIWIIELIRQGRFPCLFHLLTGYYCPGCGGTRAVTALLHGDPFRSFLYHPLVIYCGAVCLVFASSYGLNALTGGRIRRARWRMGYLYAGIGLIAVNFLAKNALLLFWGVDLLRILDGGS